ncbi:hypothetical protein Psch_00029 [Pelotomaculum schinkii]|uniref:Uncharacterized protein n=1 Tax=Pelotomaculum schinkii TaxID=78350 RepID=A0A4Y7RDU0_9FIRM|nr:hypothetical protein [Pelotomaculum schinkii]TEB06497.1 hypothetical protein Psch_00029 [Pelotomaculum schinkii]
MSSVKDYLTKESASLQELSGSFAPEYQHEVMKSSLESSLLPEASFNLLLLAEGATANELLHNLAQVAYDRFVSGYLEQMGTYAALTVEELSGVKVSVFSGQDFGTEQLEKLLALFTGARSDDPVLEWFVSDGATILSDVRTRLLVKDVDGLAALIRQLEYYSVFFSSPADEVESYSYLIDIVERIVPDLTDLKLLTETKTIEVVLGKEIFEFDQWVNDAFHLIDWKECFLKIAAEALKDAAQKISKDTDDKNEPKSQGSLIIGFTSELEASQWSLGVIDEIDIAETEKGGLYGQAGAPTSGAAA